MNTCWKRLALFCGVYILGMICLITAPVFAEETSVSGETEADSKVKYKFYLQSNYQMNFNHPESGYNDYRVFDQKLNTVLVDLIEAFLYKDAEIGSPWGFRLRVTGGETAKYLHARGLGKAGDTVDLTEANVTYAFPRTGSWKLSAGKFCSYIGAEVIEAADDANYSRSFLYGYAQPFTLTGAKLSYDCSSKVNATAFFLNGWDTFDGCFSSASTGLALTVKHSDAVTSYFNVINGPEQNNNTFNNRFLFDWVGAIQAGEKLSFLLNYDNGNEKQALADGANATWNGFSLIAKYDFTERFSFAARGEYFNDPQGFRTGTVQKLKEFTLSPQFKIGSNALLRPEYRFDWSDVNSFNDGNNKSQGTLGLGLMITF